MKKIKLKKKKLKEYLELAIPLYKKMTNEQKAILLEHNTTLQDVISTIGDIK